MKKQKAGIAEHIKFAGFSYPDDLDRARINNLIADVYLDF